MLKAIDDIQDSKILLLVKIPTEMLLWIYVTLAKTFSDVKAFDIPGRVLSPGRILFSISKRQKQFFVFGPFYTHAHFYMVFGIKEHLNPNPAT